MCVQHLHVHCVFFFFFSTLQNRHAIIDSFCVKLLYLNFFVIPFFLKPKIICIFEWFLHIIQTTTYYCCFVLAFMFLHFLLLII